MRAFYEVPLVDDSNGRRCTSTVSAVTYKTAGTIVRSLGAPIVDAALDAGNSGVAVGLSDFDNAVQFRSADAQPRIATAVEAVDAIDSAVFTEHYHSPSSPFRLGVR